MDHRPSEEARSHDEAGRRAARKLLAILAALMLCALGGMALHVRWHAPAKFVIYAELQQRANASYFLFWTGVAGAALLLAFVRKAMFVSFCLLLLILAEGGAHLYFYTSNRSFYRPTPPVLLQRFEPHPLLVGIPHPGQYGSVGHDAEHRRTTRNEGKATNPKWIFLFGGSTTYDIGNRDNETWASDLSGLLGEGYSVANFGVPGYSSLESMIQSLFAFRETRPACAVYLVGWNDLRNSHITGLKDDYSDFHLPRQVGNLAVGHRPGFLENNVLLLRLAAMALLKEVPDSGPGARGEVSEGKDERLSRIFKENMELIAGIDRHFGVRPLFVPQVLNYAEFKWSTTSRWLPFVRDRDVKPLMMAMNEDLEEAARQSQATFIRDPLLESWQTADFVDNGHFSAAGARKFARSLLGPIQDSCR